MKTKKITSIILALILAFCLSGCQLALENGAVEESDDMLIGVYVSYEHVDLFDIEGYLNENLNSLGGEIKLGGDTNKYEGKLYATQKSEIKTATEGEKYTETSFVFEELDGFGMFSPTITDTQNSDQTYIMSNVDEGISYTKLKTFSGDNDGGIELEGTIYVASGAMSDALYINPVYQASDGRVYLVSGSGFSVQDAYGEGGVYAQTISEDIKATDNGKTLGRKSTIKISIASIYPTESVTIIQMDKDSKIVKANYFKPEEMPSEFVPESETEYIIVEEAKLDYNQKTVIDRLITSKAEDTFWFFKNGDNKIMIKTYTEILWDTPEEIARIPV